MFKPVCVLGLIVYVQWTCTFSLAGECVNNQLQAEIFDVSASNFKLIFKLKNVGDEGVCVLKWNTMMDDTFWASAVTLFQGEDILDYAKPIIPIRQEMKDSDYAFVGVGDEFSFQTTKDLSDVFSFSTGKKYFVQIETKPSDCYTASKSTDCKVRSTGDQKGLEYNNPEEASVDFSFTATATKAATQETFGEWLGKNTPERKNVDDTIVAFGTKEVVSEEKFNQVVSAHREGSLYLELASSYLKEFKNIHVPLFELWFGKYSKENYEHVRDNFIETFKETKKPHVYNFLPSTLCKPSWLAHVDAVLLGKKQHIINLCDGFFTQKDFEKGITIAHEMTHDSSATHDQKIKGTDCYGTDNCKALAEDHPELAIESAESYALFARDVFILETTKPLPPKNVHKIDHPDLNPSPNKKPKKDSSKKVHEIDLPDLNPVLGKRRKKEPPSLASSVKTKENLLFKLFDLVKSMAE